MQRAKKAPPPGHLSERGQKIKTHFSQLCRLLDCNPRYVCTSHSLCSLVLSVVVRAETADRLPLNICLCQRLRVLYQKAGATNAMKIY